MRTFLPAAAAVLLMLGGCTSSGTFPSLAPRAVEGLASQPERETGAPARALDAALETEVAAIAARVAVGEREWQASLAEARLIVGRARGQAVGSEPWVLAQQAIGRLDAARAPMTSLVESLDRLRIAQAESSTPADSTRLDALWERAVALSTAQNAAYADLAAAIPLG